jgi:hypothetical protein
MYMSVKDINYVCFYDYHIMFLNYSGNVSKKDMDVNEYA